MSKPFLLSTKTLPSSLRERIVQNDLVYMEYNAIRILPVDFEITTPVDYVIFSSQNATKAVLNKTHHFQGVQVLCVGERSEKLLLEKNIKPLKTAQNMSDLIDFIQILDKNSHFLHYCGNRRLPILAHKMKEWECDFREVVVYQTELTNTKIDAAPNAILFFSPSGVESHESQNDITDAHCFCIGNTTATAFKQKPKSIQIVQNANMEQLVAKAIHYFKILQHA